MSSARTDSGSRIVAETAYPAAQCSGPLRRRRVQSQHRFALSTTSGTSTQRTTYQPQLWLKKLSKRRPSHYRYSVVRRSFISSKARNVDRSFLRDWPYFPEVNYSIRIWVASLHGIKDNRRVKATWVFWLSGVSLLSCVIESVTGLWQLKRAFSAARPFGTSFGRLQLPGRINFRYSD